MELSLSGNAVKTFARSITCLARIGNELVLQSSSSQLSLYTLNASRSAYQTITFKPDFFDVYTVSGPEAHCSVLLKAVCSLLRTPIASIDHLSVNLADSDVSKVQWTLNCYNGIKKAYWITCNVDPDIQQLSLDRTRLPSSIVVRPRDLNRLLANFQSTLQEITLIATQQSALPPDDMDQMGGKSVELRSYLDPTKENDSSLHTQLWIDPTEEFVQYTHTGDPVDVTFGVKELKAFLAYCEGCEVDIQICFDKASEPLLMAPKFGLDDGSSSNFNATLVLATMLVSQLTVDNSAEPEAAPHTTCPAQQGSKGNASGHPSDHTRIWSELSESAARHGSNVEDRQVPAQRNQNTNEQRMSQINIGHEKNVEAGPSFQDNCHPMEPDNRGRSQVDGDGNGHVSQRHPKNWVDDDEDDEEDESDLCVQSTPPY